MVSNSRYVNGRNSSSPCRCNKWYVTSSIVLPMKIVARRLVVVVVDVS